MKNQENQFKDLKGWEFTGGQVVINKEEYRIQVIFDEKPSKKLREKLKKNGFHWTPKQNAWQRLLNYNGLKAVYQIEETQSNR